jgi:AraC-like DNA-binding protein
MSVVNTMTVSQMADSLLDDNDASWTRLGAYAIAEYLDNLSDDIGEPIKWDRVAVRCDFSEYTLSELLNELGDSLNLDWQAIAMELLEGGEFPIADLIEELQEQSGCVIHVVQGTNLLTGVTDEDTFIIQDF